MVSELRKALVESRAEADATIWDKVGNPAPEDIAASMRREIFCEHQDPVDDCDTCADKG